MGLLTHDEKQFFKDNGYLVKRDVLPEDLMERAVDGLWHGLMVHSASKNCSRNIRMGLFTRFKWKNWNELQFETPDDMWEYWEGLNGR